MIGRIQRVELRDVWRHEAYDFTAWLQDNIEVLNEATGLSLGAVEREQSAGTFNVDLIAEDASGRAVVVENQLDKSDHDHLGKVLTYLVAVEARQAIWIVAEPRPEHVGVISWLNESSSADFYLVKLEAISIGDSEPAPLLTLIVGPSEETREVSRTKQEMAERERLRYRFFEGLLARARLETSLHANISPGTANWVGAGAGITGLGFNYVVRQRDVSVELYVDTSDAEQNRDYFSQLQAHSEEIESEFGEALEWDVKDGRRACRIRKTYDVGGYRDEDDWAVVYEVAAKGMARLEKALAPFLRGLGSVHGSTAVTGPLPEKS